MAGKRVVLRGVTVAVAVIVGVFSGCARSHERRGDAEPPVRHDGGPASFDGGCRDGLRCDVDVTTCERRETVCADGVAVCVAAGPRARGEVCRPARVECDATEVCDGVSTACPDDALAEVGVPCETGSCDGCGNCVFDPCLEGVLCDTGDQCMIGNVSCACSPVCVLVGPQPAGLRCDDGDPCTADDACDGAGRCVGGPMVCAGE